MKRYILSALVVLVCTFVYASEADFNNALKNCTPYSGSGSLTTSGIEVKTTKKILGFQGDRCAYVEKINMMGIDSVISCKFTKPQIQEISAVMEAYELTQKYSGEKPDLSDLESAQNNPVARLWSRYIQDPSVCNISTQQ